MCIFFNDLHIWSFKISISNMSECMSVCLQCMFPVQLAIDVDSISGQAWCHCLTDIIR